MTTDNPKNRFPAALACVPALVAWALAGSFSAKWLLFLRAGNLTFGAGSGAFLTTLWTLVPICGAVALVVAVLTVCGKISMRWQAVSFLVGIVALLLVVGD